MSEKTELPRYLVTTDVVIFTVRQNDLEILLVQRAHPPFQGQWALPGGFVEPDEDLETSARRELQEETGIRDLPLEQVQAFGAPGRDPRGRVITIAYYALLPAGSSQRPQAASDAAATDWFPIDQLPPLAFDHAEILNSALQRLHTRESAAVLGLLPAEFSLNEAHRIHELIRGESMDEPEVRDWLLNQEAVEETDATRGSARLYRRKRPAPRE